MRGTIRIALIFGSQVYLDLKMINHEFQLVMPLPHVSSQIATADDVEFTPDISAFPCADLTSLMKCTSSKIEQYFIVNYFLLDNTNDY